jgi:hypothetical protein
MPAVAAQTTAATTVATNLRTQQGSPFRLAFPAGAGRVSPGGEQTRMPRVSRRLLTVAAAASLVVPAGVAVTSHASPTQLTTRLTADGVVASVHEGGASLSNGRVSRTWSVGRGVRTVGLVGPSGRALAGSGPDFTVTVNGAPTSSVVGWQLVDVTAVPPTSRPGRPASGTGAALLFRYSLAASAVNAAGVELDRLVALRPGSAVYETQTTVRNHGPATLRIPAYRLDQIAARNPAAPTEVHAYVGGSDWRDDYRHISHPVEAFDIEGEVARFGGSDGFFLVSQRRGGVMSRAGRDAGGASWVGVDWARDAFDFGPLRTQPPSYNRLRNPAYPAPVRARVLPPLGTLNLGTSFLGAYAGGDAEAAAEFARAFVGAAEPAFARDVDLNTFHPWSHGPDMSDPNLRTQVDRAAALGIDTFMLDDQWQGGAGGESGDWRFDPARFPDNNGDGVPDLVTYIHQHGLNLGLWMSPVEFNGASTTYKAHPQWACAPTGDVTAQIEDDAGLGVWDVTKQGFQRYLLGVVDRLVRDYDVTAFKFDFMAWVDCVPHDYADYEDAFVSLVHQMQQRHPTVTFELDETNDQRLWPFESAEIGPSWFDNGHLHGSGAVPKLLHDIWTAAPWVPTATIGMGVYDGTLRGDYPGVRGVDALMPLALLSHATFWTDLTTLAPDEQAETAWWLQWYDAHRSELGPVVYELTGQDPLGGNGWAAWQPWTGSSGYVFAFRQAGGTNAVSLRLHGVANATSYTVTDVRTNTVLGSYTGAQLANGLPVTLPTNSATVLAVNPG